MATKRTSTGQRVMIPKKAPVVAAPRNLTTTQSPYQKQISSGVDSRNPVAPVRALTPLRPSSGLQISAGITDPISGQKVESSSPLRPEDPAAITYGDIGIFGSALDYPQAPQFTFQYDPQSGVPREQQMKDQTTAFYDKYKAQGLSPSDVTKMTRPDAGDLLKDPLSGAMGKTTIRTQPGADFSDSRSGAMGKKGDTGDIAGRLRDVNSELSGIDTDFGDASTLAPEQRSMVEASEQQKRTALTQERESLQKQQYEQQKMLGSQQTGKGIPTKQDIGAKMSVNKALLGLPPELRDAYSKTFEGINSREQIAEIAMYQSRLDAGDDRALSDMLYEEGKATALESRERELELARETDVMQRDRQEEIQRQQLATVVSGEMMLNVETARAEQTLRRQNTENELQNRRTAAKMGINMDTGGLEWMQKQVTEGQENIAYLISKASVLKKEFADDRLKIINDYAYDMKVIDANTQGRYDKAFSDYKTTVASLRKDRILDEKDIRKSEREQRQHYYDTLGTLDKERGDAYKEANIKAMERNDGLEDDRRADAQNAMSNLLTLRGQGVQKLSGEMLKAIQDKLPGIDVNAILKDPTNTALKNAQSAATDLNTSSASFSDPIQASIMDGANLAANGMAVANGESFRNEVARKLRSGDTGGARNYMYTQIANNLKGTALTEYDNRSAQTLQITSILGMMDSKPEFDYGTAEYIKQRALAVIGQASPEYYSMMAPIAQLSSEITHGLSGAAVSPSEWDRLQKFMPRTGEGKDVLKTKLKGLLKETTWQNEAKIARAAGLPIPPDPFLSKAEQKSQVQQKEEYIPSNDDINDTLHPANGSPLSYITNFRVTQEYGSLWDQEQGYMNSPHYAIDLAPKVKGELTYVPSLRGGKVVSSGFVKGTGNTVVIEDYDGNKYTYGHLASLNVKVGDEIDDDYSLGVMGKTGSTDGGVHLHLAVQDPDGNYKDPRDYLT